MMRYINSHYTQLHNMSSLTSVKLY